MGDECLRGVTIIGHDITTVVGGMQAVVEVVRWEGGGHKSSVALSSAGGQVLNPSQLVLVNISGGKILVGAGGWFLLLEKILVLIIMITPDRSSAV